MADGNMSTPMNVWHPSIIGIGIVQSDVGYIHIHDQLHCMKN